jgi:4-amino-4-deoxy-L-arabinose transferase-like glycosyltransferase
MTETPDDITARPVAPAGQEPALTSPGRRLTRLLSRHWPVFVACGLTFALRATLIAIIHSQPNSDSLFYLLSGRAIAAGQGYSFDGHPTAFFPVGWPAFIAFVIKATGSAGFTTILWAGAVLWTASTALVYVFALRLGGRAAAIVAVFLMAVYPDFLMYGLRALSEALFIPLLLAMCIALTPPAGTRLSTRRAALAGALLGAAILVRSTAAPVPLVLALAIVLAFRDKRALRAAAIFTVIAYLVVAPWVVRNQLVMHTFALSTNGGYTLWLGDNPAATGSNQVIGVRHPHWAVSSAAAEVADNRLRTRESLDFMEHHFRQWVGLIPAKFFYLFKWAPGALVRSTEQAATTPEQNPPPRALTPLEGRLVSRIRDLSPVLSALNVVWWSLAGLAAVAAVARRRPGAVLVAVIVGFWILMHATVVHGQFRYMLSVQPLLMPVLGWGAVWLVALAARSLRRRTPRASTES